MIPSHASNLSFFPQRKLSALKGACVIRSDLPKSLIFWEVPILNRITVMGVLSPHILRFQGLGQGVCKGVGGILRGSASHMS